MIKLKKMASAYLEFSLDVFHDGRRSFRFVFWMPQFQIANKRGTPLLVIHIIIPSIQISSRIGRIETGPASHEALFMTSDLKHLVQL